MPLLTSTDKFLELLRLSNLLSEQRVDEFLRANPRLPDRADKLAARLVRAGLLTDFQAKQLLVGKWKGFVLCGKYKLLELLGSGGMGQVFLCEHIMLRRLVALKVLPADKTEEPAAIERFYREARAVAALEHPNIVRVHDVDRDGKLHIMIMEYVYGASLQQVIDQHGPLSIPRAAHYMSQASNGLSRSNQVGWIHRDVKPGNILLDRQGTIKILDMGLARLFHDRADVVTKKYNLKNVLGTADYLSPEQAVNAEVDIRADLYSLGATFYFVLTGRPPFEGGTVSQKLIWHQVRQPQPIQALRPEVPAALAAIVHKLMAKNPADRLQSPGELMAALQPWTEQPIGPPPEKEMPRVGPVIWDLYQSGGAVGSSLSTYTVIHARKIVAVTPTAGKPALSQPAPARADTLLTSLQDTPPDTQVPDILLKDRAVKDSAMLAEEV